MLCDYVALQQDEISTVKMLSDVNGTRRVEGTETVVLGVHPVTGQVC